MDPKYKNSYKVIKKNWFPFPFIMSVSRNVNHFTSGDRESGTII